MHNAASAVHWTDNNRSGIVEVLPELEGIDVIGECDLCGAF